VVVGPPGSGRSSFLRLLTGRLEGLPGLTFGGDIKYNGYSKDEFELNSSVAYVDQV
jgi:ABC-type multidrug transport system ATPase subunit